MTSCLRGYVVLKNAISGQLSVGVSLIESITSTDGFEANQFNLDAMLSLSKRTGVFALYSRLTNGKSATHDNTEAGGVSPGADTTQAALGISHSF